MPLPAEYRRLKIHPAIGIARLSTNDDFFVYGTTPPAYKSHNLMKRQAVQFRMFAYGENNTGLEEVDAARLEQLGLRVVWHARVANGKIARIMNQPALVISAQATSDVADGQLVGRLDGFQGGDRVPLGQIRPDGVFLPPRAEIYKRRPDQPISGALHDPDVSDNTSDGMVTAQLWDRATNQPVDIEILPAWILVAPADFSPDLDDPDKYARPTLAEWLVDQLGLPNPAPATPVNQTAQSLDRDVLQRATSDFTPGIEVSADDLPILSTVFYTEDVTGDPAEIRVRPKSQAGGVEPGELTYGLCSPWQSDFLACTCIWWAAHRPDTAFKNAQSNESVKWLRRKADAAPGIGGFIQRPDDIVEHVDKLGVVRRIEGREVETERGGDIE